MKLPMILHKRYLRLRFEKAGGNAPAALSVSDVPGRLFIVCPISQTLENVRV